MSAAAVTTTRGLYRSLLRTGARFNDYNFREFAMRKTRSEFRQVREAGVDKAQLWEHGVGQLQMLERQVAIDNMYSHHRLPVELQR